MVAISGDTIGRLSRVNVQKMAKRIFQNTKKNMFQSQEYQVNVKKSGHKNTKSTHSLKQMRTYKFISGIGLQRPLPNCAYLSNSSWVFTFWWRHPAILSRFRAGALRLVLGCLAKINILLMMKGTVWWVGVCDFWHCLSWPYFHISAYLCTFSVFLHFPTLLYFCISVFLWLCCKSAWEFVR